jgi:hypothetical protein
MNRIQFSAFAFFAASPALADIGSCPISCDFITTPEILEATVPIGVVQVQSRTHRSFVTGAMVSIECTEIDADVVFPGASDEAILRQYLQFWAIEPFDNAISEGSVPHPHVVLSGSKQIQGVEVIYSYRLFRFPGSFAMVAVGSPIDYQDSADVQRFLESIEIQPLENEFSEEEKLEGRKNHIAACIPAIRADNDRKQLGMTEIAISFFCSCTGMRYFDEFSRDQLKTLALGTGDDVEARREQIQSACFEEAMQ